MAIVRQLYLLRAWLCALPALLGACAAPMGQAERFVVYYGEKAAPETLNRYSLVILDAGRHPELAALKPYHTRLGYVSIGEAAPHEAETLDPSLIVKANEDWGSAMVDLRQPQWRARLLEQTIPAALEKGFDGLMLDTVDSAIHLEASEPERFAGMTEAAADLIRTIRARFPHAKLMLNRGFEVQPAVAGSVDMILAESILSRYDLESGKATFFPDDVYAHYVEKLHRLRRQYPHLRVYSLDYWDMMDKKGVAEIYRIQRSNGFTPYVTTPDLNTIHPEHPAGKQNGRPESAGSRMEALDA